VTFDFMEMAIVPDTGFYGNTTRVDQFGFPVRLRLQGLGGYDQPVGETATRASLFSAWASAVPAQFQGLAQAPYSPYRIVAPAHGSFGTAGANAHYLDSYIHGLWTKYASQTLTFTDQQGTFTGHVVNGQFQFTDGQGTYTIARAPNTQEALLGNGVLNDATGQTPGTAGYDKQLQIQRRCARRSIATSSRTRPSGRPRARSTRRPPTRTRSSGTTTRSTACPTASPTTTSAASARRCTRRRPRSPPSPWAGDSRERLRGTSAGNRAAGSLRMDECGALRPLSSLELGGVGLRRSGP
jgi:hypothetical protein